MHEQKLTELKLVLRKQQNTFIKLILDNAVAVKN